VNNWPAVLIFSSIACISLLCIGAMAPRVNQRLDDLVLFAEWHMHSLFMLGNARWWVIAFLCISVTTPLLIVLVTHNWLLMSTALALLTVLPKFVIRQLLRKRRRTIVECLPDALAQLAASLRAGSSFQGALQLYTDQQPGPLAQEFTLVLREHRMGIRLDDAMDNLAERVHCEELDLMVSAVLIAQDVGGNLASILLQLSTTIRHKLMLEGKVGSLTAQGKLQALVISALPVAVLGALVVIEPRATLPIFEGLLGWVCLSIMLFMQLLGALMIRKIVSIEL